MSTFGAIRTMARCFACATANLTGSQYHRPRCRRTGQAASVHSRNGAVAGTGVLWSVTPLENANNQVVPGTLRAFDAADLSREIWNSRPNAKRDDLGRLAKFNTPIVANGKVYVATFSSRLLFMVCCRTRLLDDEVPKLTIQDDILAARAQAPIPTSLAQGCPPILRFWRCA